MEKRSYKKVEKMCDSTTQDRISGLPDSVLLHILSFLDDMKQVQITSVLSKRWEYVWISVPTLTFKHIDNNEKKAAKFVAWVHRMLLRFRNTSIEKFNVLFLYFDCFASDVDGWVRFASEKGVRDLSFNFFSSSDTYSLPHSVCCNSFLIHLSISGCKLVPKRGLSWASLKSLSMLSVVLNDDIIAKILLGSPMLEYLKFDNCFGFKHVNIKSESLRKLVIHYDYTMCRRDVRLLEISAPNLQSLHVLGDYYKTQFRLMSFSSMLKVKLNFSPSIKDGLDEIELLESLRHVSELELGSWCIEAFAPLLVEGKTLPSPLTALTCLKVNAFIDKQVAAGIISLLKCSPNLEKLVLKRPIYDLASRCPKQVEEYWESGRMIEKFSLPRLKTIKCHGFKKLVDAGEFTLTLVQVLLENAGFLECVVP